jgi:hypothetical protein
MEDRSVVQRRKLVCDHGSLSKRSSADFWRSIGAASTTGHGAKAGTTLN